MFIEDRPCQHMGVRVALLEADQATIEAEFGEPLDWQRMNDKKGCRIAVYRTDLDPRDESQRLAQFEWFLDHLGLDRWAYWVIFGDGTGDPWAI